jgi:serine phosphatase RsbU (regulator of sigma subunit)
MAGNMHTPKGARTHAPAATSGGPMRMLLVVPTSPQNAALIDGLRAKACRVDAVSEADLGMHLAACGRPDVVLVAQTRPDGLLSPLILVCLERLHLPVLVMGGDIAQLIQHVPEWLCDAADRGASADEIFGRACTLAKMAEHGRRMNAKLRKLRRIGRHLQCNYEQIDNELLLAGQLQRDFLPTHLPEVPGLRFVTLMRPYSWVSGDIYDIFRIDENHVGMYVADAVGHGVAAGLLTMFIKQAIVPKRVANNTYRIVGPAEVLHELNQAMTVHNLPNCQYVTICYCVLDVRTLMVQVACAAHPAPILLGCDGQVRSIECDSGCVIGVFPQQQYEQTEFELKVGQRMIVHSDGLEEAFGRGPDRRNRWLRLLRRNARRDIGAIFGRLQQVIDRTSGSLHPEDDITAIGVEAVSEPSSPDASRN